MVKPAGAMMVKRAGAYALSFLSTGTDACKARWVHPPAGPTSLMVRLPGPTGSTKLTGWLQDYARRNGERVHLWARTGTDLPLASAASGMRWPRCRVHSGIRRIGLCRGFQASNAQVLESGRSCGTEKVPEAPGLMPRGSI
jgi:hypothetical protein